MYLSQFSKAGPQKSTITISEEHALKQKCQIGAVQLGSSDELAFAIGSKGYIPGLPVTFTFTTSTSKVTKQLTIIPARLIATSNKDNAAIEAKIVKVLPPTYSIVASGFEDGEILKSQAISFENSRNNLMTGDKLTKFAPDMQGKRGGVAKFLVRRPSGEKLTLELPWGYEWMRYLGYTDTDGSTKFLIDNPENLKHDPEMLKYFYPPKPSN